MAFYGWPGPRPPPDSGGTSGTARAFQGFLFQADAGSGCGKLSLGIGTEPDLTYVGPELDLSIVWLNLTLGVLWRVSGHAGASAVFGWGIGFGL